MKSTLKVEDPDEIEMTLTITMKLYSWKRLKDQLADSTFTHPSNKVRDAIREMVNKAEEQFEVQEETK